MTTKTPRKRQRQSRLDQQSSNHNESGNGRESANDNGSAPRPAWSVLSAQLANRGTRDSIHRVLGKYRQSPYLWAIEPIDGDSSLATAIKRLYSASRDKPLGAASLQSDFAAILHSPPLSPDTALLAIAACAALPNLARDTPPETWWQVHDALQDLCRRATLVDDLGPWEAQLFGVELPLTFAYALPELTDSQVWVVPAIDRMSQQIDLLVDGNGWIHAANLELVRPLLATWTRSWILARAMKAPKLQTDPQLRLEWFLRQALRLMRRDGSQMLCDEQTGLWCHDLFEAATRISPDREDQLIAATMLPGQEKAKRQVKAASSSSSEWAGTAVLQSHWARKSPKVAVAFHDQHLQFELARTIPLIAGKRLPEVSCDGKALAPQDVFTTSCWHRDDDVDYLELEIELEQDYRLQRQFLLARDEEFLFIADAVLGTSTQHIDYRLELDLGRNVAAIAESETAEYYLRADKIRSLVLPLGLSEWRSARSDDHLRGDERCIELAQSANGKNLYAALFFDLNPRRCKSPRTWRSLTVAEQLEIVGKDVAVAYRIQIGKAQWVVYRSLEPRGNRSFLGQNHSCEFYMGRFNKDGETTELLSIE